MDQSARALPEPTMADFFYDIYKAKFAILIGAVIGFFVALSFISFSIPHYKTEMILSPASPMTGAESSSMLADDNLFALRYLAQRIGGGGGGSDFQRFENIYAGPSVAEILLRDKTVQQGLSNDRGFTFSDAENDWSAEKLAEYLKTRVSLEPVGTSAAKKLVYYHQDQDFAEYFLSGIHRIADNLIRHNIREDAKARVDYLNDAIAKTSNTEHRRALTTLLMEQERLLMLVSIDQPYAANVIEPASSSAKTAWPNLYFVYTGFILLGMLAGFLIYNLRRQRL